MGLTLHYELRLPPDTPRADAAAMLSRLRETAVATSPDYVSPLVDLAVGEDRFPAGEDGRPWRNILFCADFISGLPYDDDSVRYSGDPLTAMGFLVDPGKGSEWATFALMRRRRQGSPTDEWYWWCACKTQYASNVSDEHFVKVHTSLVAILDAAREIGFDVEVQDEGGFWESRSTDALVAEVTRMNRLMATFAGALSDEIGNEHDIKAPIFEHRSFERLEMEK